MVAAGVAVLAKPKVVFAALLFPKPKVLVVLVCPNTDVFAAGVAVPKGLGAAGVPKVLVAVGRDSFI